MPADSEFKRELESNLRSFLDGNLKQNAVQLLGTLGYESDKTLSIQPNTAEGFKKFLTKNGVKGFNEAKAHLEDWESVDFLFQLTGEEISHNHELFDSSNVDFSESRIESYLFFAIKLEADDYKRSELAEITREINKAFPMPVMILFHHGETLTFSIIDRRLNKRDATKDVLEKVTLIKDIRLENPHRAHIEILSDLALKNCEVSNFVELHNSWQKTLDTKELNKKFFQELANWYFWAFDSVEFPDDEEKNDEVRNATSVIRLITRLMFVWFLKEKGLVSPKLFDEAYLKTIIKFEGESAYYKAVLQNLFFATLNSDMGKRKFIAEGSSGRNAQHFIHNVFRYKREFKTPDETLKELFEPIPFLNGGLFECLDKEIEIDEQPQRIRVDGFSDHKKNPLFVPDYLFFVQEDFVDLSEIYDDARKSKVRVRGLINILNSYKFTVTENTPIEEEIALDPELLGRVFENLLASYNPETKTTARKQTGSFYTPREIVNYVVDESLIVYLKQKLSEETEGFGFIALGEAQSSMFGNEGRVQQKLEIPLTSNRWQGKEEKLESALRDLFSYSENGHQFNETETEILIKAIDICKILDPACGSGAFPMGVLHRLVHLLSKLDQGNIKWKQWQKQKALKETESAYEIGDGKEREERLLEINQIFEDNSDDYGRKLFLIEQCIYGVDIQPIAIQIAKLRFFISLVVDQETSSGKPNLGVRPLPNLETKFVAANTLFGLGNVGLKPSGISELERELLDVRTKHFSAKTRKTKEKFRARDKAIRLQISELLCQAGFPATSADQVSSWNPYDQNGRAGWFDAEWMFGVTKGFDIVIGNPPWGAGLSAFEKTQLKVEYPEIDSSTPNSFAYFIGKAMRLFTNNASYVLPDSILIKDFAKTRKLVSPQIRNIHWYQNIGLPEGLRPFVYVEHDVCVVQLQRDPSPTFSQSLFSYDPTLREVTNKTKEVRKKDVIREEFDFAINLLVDADDLEILEKLRRHKPLSSFMQCHEGIHTGNSRDILFHRKKINSSCKPLFYGGGAGDEIGNYLSQRNGWFVDYRKEVIDKDEGYYASLRDERIFSLPKIYLTRTGNPFKAFFDLDSYASNNFFSLQFKNYDENEADDLKVILPFIISPVAQYFIRRFAAPRLGNTFVETKIFHLLKFRTPSVGDMEKKEILHRVNRIMEAKRNGEKLEVEAQQSGMNRLIYDLYGFSEKDIRIIEGRNNDTE